VETAECIWSDADPSKIANCGAAAPEGTRPMGPIMSCIAGRYAYLGGFETDRTVLLYPRVPGVASDVLEVLEQTDEPGTKRVEVRFVDVSVDLASANGPDVLAEELRRLLDPRDRLSTKANANHLPS